ncbi:MAG: tetratricopeptide repeat protein [Alysiella sp.]|uniref:tetratricopeptide repeat protein n=1 Tax=Alysiella sp. TaxID=1872483 RepID=UPI0026DC52F8|nr:tetratricopeptide repeat protein [Alysiella sp.]MDO4434037.1 tetratricopeptide repeat protein [Alysiella sp.]
MSETHETDTPDAGLIAYQNGDYATALKEWQQRAQNGHAQAMHNIGILYQQGLGTTIDETLAEEWIRKAAVAGLASAQTHLAYLLMQDERHQEARLWWEQAAEQNDADAQNELGLLYHHGIGLERDDDTAADFFEAAAIQGHVGAQFNLGVLYANGRRYNHARHWWEKAAALGSEDAHNALNKLVEMGI